MSEDPVVSVLNGGGPASTSASIISENNADPNITMSEALALVRSADTVCPNHPLAWECVEANCCASYQMRAYFLLFSGGVLLTAILVLLVWLTIELRPSKRENRQMLLLKRDKRAPSEVEVKSDEEAKYLRRMSELNPHARRSTVDD